MRTVEFEDITFSVDPERRTIRGLVMPWNSISTPKGGRQFRFARDAIKAVAAKFVKLFEDHNPANHRGRAIDMHETDAGLEMTFKVNPGEQGDRMLALAKSGAKTGLSVGVEFDDADTEPDPDFPGAFLVKLANFVEVSLVQEPSFSDARVRTVMYSANDTGEIMEETKTPAVEETATEPAKVEFTGIPEGYKLVHIEDKPAAGPDVIVPRTGMMVEVKEPANYVFDASGELKNGKHDFGLDLVQGLNTDFNDLGARQRAQEFIDATFAAEGIVTSNVNELAPTRNVNRYIDKRDYRSPVFEAIRKGSVTSMNGGGTTPFQWPIFSSSSGLVAAGTEGEEPTVGTYVTSSATVTPTTLRGKAAISREMWDAGGVPNIGNVIWTQMVRDYQEALEAKIVATLDAASPTSLGTFTAGGGTTGQTLTAQMRSHLAGLQFARGGFSMGYLFAQADLFVQLAGALDTTGRPILPAVGPTNTDGTARSRWGSLDINGVSVLPAWALAAAGQTTAASSYLIDPTAVDGWADAPRRLFFDIAVSNVYLGIWGYAATVINDIAGVREVIYDPTA
jgi:HK97 family phage prohead protease